MAQRSNQGGGLAAPVILIVDDREEVGLSLVRLFRSAGHQAVAVTGGTEAMAFLEVSIPKLMILDLNMPKMDGLQVLRRMKVHDAFKAIPVVVYTADIRPERHDEAMGLGVLDFVVKGPLGFDQLVAHIRALGADHRT